MMLWSIKTEIPKVQEYLNLRKNGGLSPRGEQASELGLKNSLFSICIREDETGQLVGMGRIVGDGGTSYQIVDIVVHPKYQKQGLGKRIMENLMVYINEKCDPLAYVNLIADVPANKLYEQFGFVETSPSSVGMYLKRKK
ncbi:GNAT family N-acetyltransferase [Enterococcus wangshanyuanii]|uniref:N-acetyltransferase n=1 Tax=Enterococcus wangshanyuanii TaxID=2005703 RepID=A0ABQ1NK01_9ENTE|nr:GNAT family N-acetyltransferase [Enterococcus wangshanyuanii]GGC77135.1 N-acetyltransferase [Enterococcus wangshanyuanii]